MLTLGATTTTAVIDPVCPKCGTMEKSGKRSCCGRGGSWFRNCGASGSAKLTRTWYEGIQACKARSESKAVIAHAVQQKRNHSFSYGNFKSDNVMSTSTRVSISIRTPAYTPANVSIKSATRASIDTSISGPAQSPASMSSHGNMVNREAISAEEASMKTTTNTSRPKPLTIKAAPTSRINSATYLLATDEIQTSTSISIVSQGCTMLLLRIGVHIGLLLVLII